ncbi:MAG: hypothetical protein IJ618_10355 [Prevotella sp.]|nr:hypothetical protein [Prevotella sp.]
MNKKLICVLAITANAYRVDKSRPEFDLMNYLVCLYAALPDVFGNAYIALADKAYNDYIVQQQNSNLVWQKSQKIIIGPQPPLLPRDGVSKQIVEHN